MNPSIQSKKVNSEEALIFSNFLDIVMGKTLIFLFLQYSKSICVVPVEGVAISSSAFALVKILLSKKYSGLGWHNHP